MAHLKIIFAADLHGNKALYEKLFQEAKDGYKAVILGGDVCPKSQHVDMKKAMDEQHDFLLNWLFPKIEDFKKHSHIDIFIITGNDDFKCNVQLFEDAEKKGIIKFLNNHMYKLDDFFIAGYPFVNPTPFHLKDWEKGDLKAEHNEGLRSVPEGPQTSMLQDLEFLGQHVSPEDTIYVMHAPPHNTKLDRLYGGQHVGSRAIRHFIEHYKPYLTLHGHIHESPEVSGDFMELIGETVSINPGSEHHKNKLIVVTMDLYSLASIKRKII